MTLLMTLVWIRRVLLFWTLWLHGGEEWDGGVACDGRALQVVHLAWSLWMVQFGTWWPDGGLIGDGPAYHIGRFVGSCCFARCGYMAVESGMVA